MAQTTEEKVKAEDRARTEQAAAATGAKAVAEAVAKVANAAADAASRTAVQTADLDFQITGQPGGLFEIRSNVPHLSSSGSVLIGGKAQETYEWGADYIRGKLDAGVKSGEVVVQIDPQTKRTGYLKVV